MPFKPEDIPLDCLPLVLEHLPSRRDLSRCALVNRAFHSAAIPILYRTLDAQIRMAVSTEALEPPTTRGLIAYILSRHQKGGGDNRVVHSSATLLRHPEYAQFVRHIEQSGMLSPCIEFLRRIS